MVPFYLQVAEQLVEQLKAGTAPWQVPRDAGQYGFSPMNPAVGKPYRGINGIWLMAQGRSDPRWLTYTQAQRLDGQVQEGERSTFIQHWKFEETRIQYDKDGNVLRGEGGEPITELVPLECPLSWFSAVFNAEQTEGLPPLVHAPRGWDPVERAQRILNASGVEVRVDGSAAAHYHAATDSIHLPDKSQYPSAEQYSAAAIRELARASGHSSRLGRDVGHPPGSEGDAREALRTGIASMMLADVLAIGHDPGAHAAYVDVWIELLEHEPLEIFRAARDASAVVDYVLGIERKLVQTPEPDHQVAAVQGKPVPQPEGTKKGQERDERVYLEVPYVERDVAKGLGARWDRDRKAWYVPGGVDQKPFGPWLKAGEPRAATQEGARPDRVYLAVPYSERNQARAAGARWDRQAKSWYAPAGADMTELEHWHPERAQTVSALAANPREEFAGFLREMGCIVSEDHPILDGRPHRIAVQGDQGDAKAGLYVAHVDADRAWGYIKNHRTREKKSWTAKGYHMSDAERANVRRETENTLQQRVADEAETQEHAAATMQDKLDQLRPVETLTPYMAAKGLQVHGGVFTDNTGTTYVPGMDVEGNLRTVQFIKADGNKQFAKNGQKDGCFHVVGGFEALAQAPALVVAQGYAAAATLTELLGHPVVAAFDASNLKEVAKGLRPRYPDKAMVIAGNDDVATKLKTGTNPGRLAAEETAKEVGAAIMFPSFAPAERGSKEFSDWNDLATKSALGRVAAGYQARIVVEGAITAARQLPPVVQLQAPEQTRSRARRVRVG